MAIGDRPVKYAGFARRFAALVLDAVLTTLFILVMALAYFSIDRSSDRGEALSALLLAFLAIMWITIYLWLWSRSLSIGKWLVGTRVVTTDGEPALLGTMFLREVVARLLILALITPLTLLTMPVIWHLWALWDKDLQTLHDKIAGTLVVYDRGEWIDGDDQQDP